MNCIWPGDYCANCHGADLKGSRGGPALINVDLLHGDSTRQLIASITRHPNAGNEPNTLDGVILSAHATKALALYVSEKRQSLPTIPDSHQHNLPAGTINSQHHDFRVERHRTIECALFNGALAQR